MTMGRATSSALLVWALVAGSSGMRIRASAAQTWKDQPLSALQALASENMHGEDQPLSALHAPAAVKAHGEALQVANASFSSRIIRRLPASWGAFFQHVDNGEVTSVLGVTIVGFEALRSKPTVMLLSIGIVVTLFAITLMAVMRAKFEQPQGAEQGTEQPFFEKREASAATAGQDSIFVGTLDDLPSKVIHLRTKGNNASGSDSSGMKVDHGSSLSTITSSFPAGPTPTIVGPRVSKESIKSIFQMGRSSAPIVEGDLGDSVQNTSTVKTSPASARKLAPQSTKGTLHARQRSKSKDRGELGTLVESRTSEQSSS